MKPFLTVEELNTKVKTFSNGFTIGGIKNIKQISKVLSVATDKKSVAASKSLVGFLDSYINTLPVDKMTEEGAHGCEKKIHTFLGLKNNLESFLEPLNKIVEKDVILDDKDVCIIMDNLNSCVLKCEFIIDYLSTAKEIHLIKKSLQNIHSSISIGELKNLLK